MFLKLLTWNISFSHRSRAIHFHSKFKFWHILSLLKTPLLAPSVSFQMAASFPPSGPDPLMTYWACPEPQMVRTYFAYFILKERIRSVFEAIFSLLEPSPIMGPKGGVQDPLNKKIGVLRGSFLAIWSFPWHYCTCPENVPPLFLLLMCRTWRGSKGVFQISPHLGGPKGKFLFLRNGKVLGYNGAKNDKDWSPQSIFCQKSAPHLLEQNLTLLSGLHDV